MKRTHEQTVTEAEAEAKKQAAQAVTNKQADATQASYKQLIYKALDGAQEGKFAIIHPESDDELGIVDGAIKPLIDACYDLYMQTCGLVDQKNQVELSQSELKKLLKTDYEKAVTNILYQVALKSFNGFKAVVGNQSLSGALEGKRLIDEVRQLLAMLGDNNVPTHLSDHSAEIARVFSTAFAQVSKQLNELRTNYVDQNTRIYKIVKPIIKSVLENNSNFTGELATNFGQAVANFDNNVQGVEVIAPNMPKLIHQLEAQLQTLDTEVTLLEEVNKSADLLEAQFKESGQRRPFAIQLKALADSVYLAQDAKEQINIFYNELTALYKEEHIQATQNALDSQKDDTEVKKPTLRDRLKAAGKKVKDKVISQEKQKAHNPNNAKIDDALLKFMGKTLAVLKTREQHLKDARAETLTSLNTAKRNPFKQLFNLFFKLHRAIQNAKANAREKRALRKDEKMSKASAKVKADFKKSPESYEAAQKFFGKNKVVVKGAVQFGAILAATEDKTVTDKNAEPAVSTVKRSM